MNATEFFAATQVPPDKILWNELYDRVERAGQERDRDFLDALFVGFEQDSRALYSRLYYTIPAMVMDCLVRSLAPNDLERIISYLIRYEALLPQFEQRLGLQRDRHWARKPREALRRSAAVAAQLGGAQALSSLHARHPSAVEFIACCTHEAILRDYSFSVEEQRAITSLIGQHPLSRLPFERLSLESGVRLHPNLIATRSMGGTSFPTLQERAELGEASLNIKIKKLEVDAKLVAEAYIGEELSNAKAEVARFGLEPASGVTMSLLESFPLYCTGRGEVPNEDGDVYRDVPAKPIEVFACTAEQAYQIFFAAGYSGRCYQAWSFAAMARLRAWNSLGAMCGAAVNDSISVKEAFIERSHFLFFNCASNWYDQIAFDIGLIAQSEDRQTITIFAGTDSD